jgi:hypothetical protein
MSRRHHIPVTRSMWQEMADADAEYQRQEAENVSPFEHHRDEGRYESGGGNAFNYIYSPSNLGGPLVDESAGAAGGSGLASGSGRRRKKSGRTADDAVTCSSQSSQSSGSSIQQLDGREVRQFYPSNPQQTYLNRMDAERREQIVTRRVSDETSQRWMKEEEDKYRREKIKEDKERREREQARARAEPWFQSKGWKTWQYPKKH